ncbi:hypothetical protein AKJ39_02930 [candidate division MSBL1 archaeon SCGC-AAA259J03]|uniref:Uncharacterized protein n=2 Tax=candidate division MSBL1 TaxID=215777 RepID=A0A133USM6_9EURY|nr:hypothetical protein AKJ38_01705 [candidate division MSBL1 archaeon SCGC-AAA259I14]KXA97870.1 hypothetical protein AKJ39_02930 [candidate division MSBL1 archaeon SCGC-AAA259J03]
MKYELGESYSCFGNGYYGYRLGILVTLSIITHVRELNDHTGALLDHISLIEEKMKEMDSYTESLDDYMERLDKYVEYLDERMKNWRIARDRILSKPLIYYFIDSNCKDI